MVYLRIYYSRLVGRKFPQWFDLRCGYSRKIALNVMLLKHMLLGFRLRFRLDKEQFFVCLRFRAVVSKQRRRSWIDFPNDKVVFCATYVPREQNDCEFPSFPCSLILHIPHTQPAIECRWSNLKPAMARYCCYTIKMLRYYIWLLKKRWRKNRHNRRHHISGSSNSEWRTIFTVRQHFNFRFNLIVRFVCYFASASFLRSLYLLFSD